MSSSSFYSGIAELGRTFVSIKFLIAIIIGSILVSIATSIGFTSDIHTESVDATVISSSCLDSIYKTTVSYTVDDVSYSGTIHTPIQHKIGDIITIKFNPNNPNDISDQYQLSNFTTALIIIGVAILLVFFTGIVYYFAKKSKAFAAFEGVVTPLSYLTSI